VGFPLDVGCADGMLVRAMLVLAGYVYVVVVVAVTISGGRAGAPAMPRFGVVPVGSSSST
jgi:hypothetical protein